MIDLVRTPMLADTRAGAPILTPRSRGGMVRVAQARSAEQQRNFLEHAMAAPPSVLLSMMSTFGESVGLLDDGDVQEWAARNFPTLGDYMEAHAGAVGAVGDIAGTFIPGALAVRAVRAGGLFARLAQRTLGSNVSKYITSTGLRNEKLFEANFQRARLIASRRGLRLDVDETLQALNRRGLRRSVGDVLIENVAADAAIVATMHQSDFLFPDEISMTENLLYFGAFNVLFGVGAYAGARYTLNRGLSRAAGGVLGAATNPGNLPLTQLHDGIVDQRGPTVDVLGAYLDDIKAQSANADIQGNRALKENAIGAQDAVQARLGRIFQRLFGDSPINGVTSATKIDPGSGELNTLQRAIQQQPFAMSGVRSLETFAEGKGAVVNATMDRIRVQRGAELEEKLARLKQLTNSPRARDQRKADKLRQQLQGEVDEYNDLVRTVGVVYELDGSVSGMTQRADIFQDGSRNIARQREGYNEVTVDGMRIRSDNGGRIDMPTDELDDIDELLEGGETLGMNSAEFLDMTHLQKTAVHDLIMTSYDRVAKGGIENWEPPSLPEGAHHTQLDFVARLIEDFSDYDILGAIEGPFQSLKEVQYAALGSKFNDFQFMRNDAAEAMAKGRPHEYADLDNVARALNLPGDSHPLVHLMEGARVEDDILPIQALGETLDEIQAQLKKVTDLPEGVDIDQLQWTGNMQRLPTDSKPVLGLLRSEESTTSVTRDQLREATLAVRAHVVGTLEQSRHDVDGSGATQIVTAVLDSIQGQPDALRAAKESLPRVVQAHDYDTIPQQFVTQAFRLRDVDAARPLDLVADISSKASDKAVENLLRGQSGMLSGDGLKPATHQEVFNRLLDKAAQGDLVQFQVARNALGHGWDVNRKAIAANGRNGELVYQFMLSPKSERNRAMWKQMFNEEMPEGARLPTGPSGTKPVTLTPLAFHAVESVSTLSNQLRVEFNALNRARNIKEITEKPWHMPPKNLAAAHRVYLLDDAGQPVTVVGGSTAAQARSLAQKEIEISARPLYAVQEASMEHYFEARGRSWFAMDDFSRPTNQTGPATGKSFGEAVEIGPRAFQDMLESLLRGYSDAGREVRKLMFEPELQYLKMQKESAGISRKAAGQTVFDLLANRIAGTQNLTADSIPGKMLIATENAYNQVMQRVFDNLEGVKRSAGTTRMPAETEAFKQINEALEPHHNPFNDFGDYLERTHGIPMPGELRKHAGALNEVTTALAIRIFDVGMGVINMASLASTLPPVIKMLQKMPTESVPEQLNRIAAWGAATPKGIGYFQPARAVASGVHFMMSKEGRALAAKARDMGYFDQFAAEQVEIYGRTGEQFLPGLLRSLTNKASIITDKTERMSRAVSFMTFLNIGKKGLGLQDEAAFAFAHSQANNVIADFRPGNRPVVFQGAAGMPFGLFTTFMWNYLQRLYNITETRNVGAALSQFGLHQFFFGANAQPGVPEFIDGMSTAYGDGSHNLNDRLHKAFGPGATDFLMNGALTHYTGFSVSPRAAIGLPLQQGFGLERQAAGIQMMTKLWRTGMQQVDTVLENRGLDVGQAAEILAQSNINKGISNMIELSMGRSLDRSGNIIEEFEPVTQVAQDPVQAVTEDVNTRLAYGARVFGFKPHTADRLRAENRRNRTTDRVRGELKERLSQSLKSKIRRGRLTGQDVEQALAHYVRAGGNPENFRRFFMSSVTRGTTSKLDLEIAKALKNSADQGRIARLLFMAGEEMNE